MPKEPLNNVKLTKKQIWEHISSEQKFVILNIAEDVDDVLCALVEEGTESTLTQLRVLVPKEKFVHYGNRGMAMVGTYPGKLPSPSKRDRIPGTFNPRNKNFGAM